MDIPGRRFSRTDRLRDTRRALRGEILALRYELECLDEAMLAGPTPISARAALDRAFADLRAAEQAWHGWSADQLAVIERIDAARDALDESVAAYARRRTTSAGA